MTEPNGFYRAIGRSMLGRYAVYGANLLSMMVLARLFSPEIYGVVAAIAVFFVFFQLMAEAGLGPAIINLKKLDIAERNGLFGLTLVVGVVFGLSFYLLTPVFSAFYNIPNVEKVVPYVAISVFFFAASIIPTAFMLREQAFFRIANAGLAAEVVSSVVSILLLQVVEPLHALAAKSVANAATNFVLLYWFCQKTEFGRPSWGTQFSAIKPLLSFSLYQFGFNFINYFSRNLDKILIGKYMGATSLGLYDKTYQLMRYPLMLLTFAMTPAIQPVLREHAHDVEKIEVIHREFAFKLSILGGCAGLAMFFFAEWIVRILLGSQWLSVSPIIQILAITIPVQVVLSTSGSFFQALGRVDLLFFSGALSALLMVTAIISGVASKDLHTLSWYLVIAFHLSFIQTYLIMYSQVYKKSVWLFFQKMFFALLCIIVMAVIRFFHIDVLSFDYFFK